MFSLNIQHIKNLAKHRVVFTMMLHYTGIDALEKIAIDRKLRLTRIDMMKNYQAEGDYILSIFREVCEDVFEGKDDGIVNYICNLNMNSANSFRLKGRRVPYTPYVASFSGYFEGQDWSRYKTGDYKSKECSLLFYLVDINVDFTSYGFLSDADGALNLLSVCYDEVALKEKIREFLKDKPLETQEDLNKLKETAKALLSECRLLFKNPKYAEENEIRLIFIYPEYDLDYIHMRSRAKSCLCDSETVSEDVELNSGISNQEAYKRELFPDYVCIDVLKNRKGAYVMFPPGTDTGLIGTKILREGGYDAEFSAFTAGRAVSKDTI